MKILLVHPSDSLEVGPWRELKWNMVVDLGWSGPAVYSEQSKRHKCRVLSIYELGNLADCRTQLQQILRSGFDGFLDSYGIDWWELFAVPFYEQFVELILISKLAAIFPSDAEMYVTRTHRSADALSVLKGSGIEVFPVRSKPAYQPPGGRKLRTILAFRTTQLLEIAFDKWDADYAIRRKLSRRPIPSKRPTVLLPSAYVNVSRAQLAFARMLPQQEFLLVTTRRSGRQVSLPENVKMRSLASYAQRPARSTEEEIRNLLARWDSLRKRNSAPTEIVSLAMRLGLFARFPAFVRSGLRVRDAWTAVLAAEPLISLLSADEHNPYTRIPVLLAKRRGIRTVACDHGALNVTLMLRPPCSDVYVGAGEMSEDYAINQCDLPKEKFVVASPCARTEYSDTNRGERKDWIVFFSEPYELLASRTEVLYSEVLPRLCSLARSTNRRVVLKLHPFELVRSRKKLIDKILSAEDKRVIDIREGPMTPDLLSRAWFTVTMESSVAVESTMRGVPCFLCRWFDHSWYAYADQFARFGAGHLLSAPEEILAIPELMKMMTITGDTQARLHTASSPEELESIVCGSSVLAEEATSPPYPK